MTRRQLEKVPIEQLPKVIYGVVYAKKPRKKWEELFKENFIFPLSFKFTKYVLESRFSIKDVESWAKESFLKREGFLLDNYWIISVA